MDLVPAQAQPSIQQHSLQICRLGLYPTLEPEGPLAIIKFNPHLFKMETLRPREGKQFVSGHTESSWTQTQFSDCIFASFLFCSFPPSQSPPANLSQGPL